MARRPAGPLAGLLISITLLLVGAGIAVDALITRSELADHGVVAEATVVTDHQRTGKYDSDYLKVAIDGRPGTVTVVSYDDHPQPGARIQLRYLPDDPSTNSEVGADGVTFQLVFGLVLAVPALGAAAFYGRRLVVRRRSGRPSTRGRPQHRRAT